MALCILCGNHVPFGGMLGHKRIVHGESLPSGKRVRRTSAASPLKGSEATPKIPTIGIPEKIATTKKKRKKSRKTWVTVYSGGLPSLGKKSR